MAKRIQMRKNRFLALQKMAEQKKNEALNAASNVAHNDGGPPDHPGMPKQTVSQSCHAQLSGRGEFQDRRAQAFARLKKKKKKKVQELAGANDNNITKILLPHPPSPSAMKNHQILPCLFFSLPDQSTVELS